LRVIKSINTHEPELLAMSKLFLAAIIGAVLVAGVAISPLLSGQLQIAHAQENTKTKKVLLVAVEKPIQVSPDNALHPGGIWYNAYTFNGTIPGPVVAIDQGDTLEITLKNDGKAIHSLDFHAGYGPEAALSGSVKPGESKTWTLKGEFPGVFLYHCGADGLNGIWEHMANGMYGGIVVHPTNEAKAKEFYVVFSELYNSADKGPFVGTNGTVGSFDLTKLWTNQPDLVLTNGMSFKYVPAIGQVNKLELNKDAQIFKVKPGELTRWYIVNAGPNDGVSFHFISGMISAHDGTNKANDALGTQLWNDETYWIPPALGSVIEATFPSPGLYVGVDHAMKDVLRGGAFAVVADGNSTNTDHPPGTWVPPKGSDKVGGASMSEEQMMASNMTASNATASNVTAS
jgi:nitrite reductase (NO-forming)